MLTRRCVGRDTTPTGSRPCPLEGQKRGPDSRFRCRRHDDAYREAHPTVTERDAIQEEGS